MPFSTRGQMKRELDQAIGNVEKAADYLLRLREQYDPDYPEYVAAIDLLLECMWQTAQGLETFRDRI